MAADFGGWVTRSGIKCSDGRTIGATAFKDMDGKQVPLVWQHQHNDTGNVLGHVVLTHQDGGVWGDGYFNDTPSGQRAKQLVQHKDITSLSIYANGLVERAKQVMHGIIREVSLVLSGANPGATIMNVAMAHGDDGELDVLADEAIIYPGDELELEHAASVTVPGPQKVQMGNKGPMPEPSAAADDTADDGGDETVQQIFDSLNDKQRELFYATVGAAAQQGATEPDDGTNKDDVIQQDDVTDEPSKEGNAPMGRNVFDQTDEGAADAPKRRVLTHSDMEEIFSAAKKDGSLKAAVEGFALQHGIDDISTLFPYDQAVTDSPDFISRRMEWVANVLGGTKKTPFARIRSWTADITFQEARAKGYVKGSLKKEEFIRIARRITTPQTVYKKQKLDRDDILDVTEFNMVTWLQTEMRLMLDEELARAILVGDGRDVDDPDKIDTSNVRPIYGDDDMYVTPVYVDLTDASSSNDEIVDAVVNAMRFYRGSGNPTFYTTRIWLAKLLLIKDTLGRRIYPTLQELQAAMGVSNIVPVEAMEDSPELIGIVVNLSDYTTGTDKGGEVNMFDFFDIDYNQYKYLMECRMSGALTKYRSALTLVQFSGAGGMLADPTAPTFDSTTGIGTIPAFSGLHLTYVTVADDGTLSSALTVGAQTAIAAGAYVTYRAVPASTYEFSTDNFEWTFRRDS
jgi:Phage capsid family/Caudovirus prohead serine protease